MSKRMRFQQAALVVACLLQLIAGCGGRPTGSGMSNTAVSATGSTVEVSAQEQALKPGATTQLTAQISTPSGSTQTITSSAQWTSSNSAVATVSTSGMVKGISAGTVIISASADGATGSATLSVAAPTVLQLSVSPSGASITAATTQQYAANATYSDSTTGDASGTVTWSVAPASVATITAAGLLNAVTPGSYTVTAAYGSVVATASGTVLPPQAATLLAAGRLLNQATFGPTSTDLAHVEQVGLEGYVQEQLAVPAYQMPLAIPASEYTGDCQAFNCAPEAWWWEDVLFGQDQLRQRVAFAASKLWVVSYNEVDPRYFPYYLNVLSQDALGNWLDLMQDVAISGAMGTYLNMANSQASQSGAHANENFAREFMQVFSIGLIALNQDGTPRLDTNGNTIPNYTSNDVQSFARAFTGYTFANDDCTPASHPRSYNYGNPPGLGCAMTPIESLHDQSAKTLLRGEVLPANQSAETDFKAAVANVFNDPSLPPFVCRRLIQNLVMSNPSPAYISRVSGVFTDNGNGIRGDMKAVISAILLDQEARAYDSPTATPSANAGLMRDPILWWTSVLRSMNTQRAMTDPYNGVYRNIIDLWLGGQGETSHAAPSVFNFYSPDNAISTTSGDTLFAPELQLENNFAIVDMMRHAQDILDNDYNLPPNVSELTMDLSPTGALGLIVTQQGVGPLLDTLNVMLMHGTMSADMKDTIARSVVGIGTQDLIRNVIYLIVTSPQYRVMI